MLLPCLTMISWGETGADVSMARAWPATLGLANMATLGLGDQGNLINERIAKKIIELAKSGELNPDLLCESVLKEFRQHL